MFTVSWGVVISTKENHDSGNLHCEDTTRAITMLIKELERLRWGVMGVAETLWIRVLLSILQFYKY